MRKVVAGGVVFFLALILHAGNSFAARIGTVDILDGAVTTPKLANGAVTDEKISGPISASKVSSVNLNADMLDGYHASEFASATHTHQQPQIKPQNSLTVAKSGGDFSSIQAAINAAVASEENPVLIVVYPGVYEENVQLKSYVHLQGSGFENTTIKSPTTNDHVVFGNNTRYSSIKGFCITGGLFGIRIEWSYSVTISGNSFINNTSGGINVYASNQIDITKNKITNGTYGIAFMSISSGNITQNDIYSCNYGIMANSSNSNLISENNIHNNSYGIQVIDGSILTRNTINYNTYGINIASNGSPSQISYNSILYNGTDLVVDKLNTSCPFSFNLYTTIGGIGSITGIYNSTYNNQISPSL